MIIADHAVPAPGGRLFARSWSPEAGTAPDATIVMIHDSLGCTELWRDVPAALAERTGRRVVAYDRLGFGRSDPHPGRLGRDFVAGETAAGLLPVCDHLGLGPVALVGHSVGGGMAVSAAPQLGARCEAVAAIATQAFIEEHTLQGIRVAQAHFADPDQVRRLARYHGDKTAWVLDAWIGTWLDPAFARFSLDEPVARMPCPLLVLNGDGDEYVSSNHPDRIRTHATGPLRIRIVPGCGHVVHREQPEIVVAEVAALLAGWSDAAAS